MACCNSGGGWPAVLLWLAWHVVPGFPVRPEENNAATRARTQAFAAAGSLLQPDPGTTERLEDRLRDSKVVRGGPYVRTCERLMDKTDHDEACTVDEFLIASWVTTWELDCQLQKAQNVLELLTSRFQQSAFTWRRFMDRASAQGNDGIAVEAAQLVPAFKHLHPCPESRGRECLGHMYYDTWDGRALIMMPQPEATGSAYSYNGSEVHVLSSRDEITVDENKINRGLWYATLLGRLENFTQTEKYYFSSGVQSKLRYHGNDPAIILELDATGSNGGKSMCFGEQNRNPVDAGNFWRYFSGDSLCEDECTLHTDDLRPYWRMGTQPQTTTVSKVTLDDNGHPMGTVSLDLSIAALGKSFLDPLHFTPTAYALIVDSSGSIIFLSPRAKNYIFAPNMTEQAIYNVDGMRRCTPENPRDCTWEPLLSMNILEAADEKYSGADFSKVMQTMFGGRQSNCSSEVQHDKIDYPRLGKDGTPHLVSFCAFSSVPDWGLIIGTKYEDIQNAASIDVVPPEVRGSHTVEEKTYESQFVLSKQVTIQNTGRVTLPFKVDRSGCKFASVDPQRGKLEPGQSQNISVNFKLSSRSEAGNHTGVLHIRGDLKEERGNCFRRAASVTLEMNILKEQSFLLKFLGNSAVWVLIVAMLVVVAGVFKMSSYFIRKHFKREARQSKIIEEALKSTKDMQFPMVLVSAIDFKRLGRLVSHEEILRDSTWLYSVDEVQTFCEENHVVFISHQWTGWDAPDPTQVQYNAMVMSLKMLQTQEDWEETNMYVWVDYSSIPQKHPPTQALAINSLTVYASNVAAFVVVAPEVQHEDLHEKCDRESYQRRAWCRAEQLAHLLSVGSKNMYLAEEDELTSLMSIDGWFRDSIYVFQGDLTCCRRGHNGLATARCDKELLVTPMLGLWAQLCQKCSGDSEPARKLRKGLTMTMDLGEKLVEVKQVHKLLGEKLNEVFPREFDFEREGGRTVRRQLFGCLLDRLQQVLNEEEQTDTND